LIELSLLTLKTYNILIKEDKMASSKIVGFLSLGAGAAVLLGSYTNFLGNRPLVLIGGVVAVVAGFLGLRGD
jgi:hypothetical protein